METKPRFKNSFGVTGTETEIELFKKEVEKIGWKYQEERTPGDYKTQLYFNANMVNSGHSLQKGHFWKCSWGNNGMYLLSTPSGWQRALSLAEEKEEEVPEYVEWNDQKDMIYELTVGKTYKLLAVEHSNKYYVVENNNGCKCQYGSSFFKPSTKESFIRQELLEEAKKGETLISVAIDKAIVDAITAFEQLSEALKETLNKIKK